MSERGTFAIDRGLFDHPRFAPEPFTEREAWTWMIGQAAFRPHCRRIGKYRVTLKRGQFAASMRFMADKWQWSESRVRRFIAKLASKIGDDDALVTHQNDAGISTISICNYNTYQPCLPPSDAVSSGENDALPTHQRRKEEAFDEGSSSREDARASDFPCDDDHEVASGFLTAIGEPPDGPLLSSVSYTAVVWRKRGYARQTVLADAAEIFSRGERFPLSYYFAAIERRHAARAREGPVVATSSPQQSSPSPPGRPHANTGTNGLARALAKLGDAAERLREGAIPDGGEDAPRLLSHG